MFIVILKYYGIGSGVSALIAALYVGSLYTRTVGILDRGNVVVIKKGPTFSALDCRSKMRSYFWRRAFGRAVTAFIVWPMILFILINDPKWWDMVEEKCIPKDE